MRLIQLQLHAFRNITQLTLKPSPDFNFIIGANGSGKSSLLEGIYLLGHGKAFRTHLASRIIQYHQHETAVFAQISTDHQALPITLGLTKSKQSDNKIKINGQTGGRQSDLANYLPIQLITPETFDLLLGGPKERRRYIDWGCFHAYPEFMPLWSQTRQLLKQRNALLKTAQHYNECQPWDHQLAQATEKLTAYRADYLKTLTPKLLSTLDQFLPDHTIQCDFHQGWDTKTSYIEQLQHHFNRDKLIGYTSIGAHKADLRLKVGTVPAEDHFSRGQLKLLVCALKLTQGEMYSTRSHHPCLYLIDDLTSELDHTKQTLLFRHLRTLSAQVFITAINDTAIAPFIEENDKIFHIKSGIISD